MLGPRSAGEARRRDRRGPAAERGVPWPVFVVVVVVVVFPFGDTGLTSRDKPEDGASGTVRLVAPEQQPTHLFHLLVISIFCQHQQFVGKGRFHFKALLCILIYVS